MEPWLYVWIIGIIMAIVLVLLLLGLFGVFTPAPAKTDPKTTKPLNILI